MLGYWENEEKTKEVMVTDEEGRLWMMTGDEGSMDKDGYLTITGRIKDIIIRGTNPRSPQYSNSQAARTFFPSRLRTSYSRVQISHKPPSWPLQMKSTAK